MAEKNRGPVIDYRTPDPAGRAMARRLRIAMLVTGLTLFVLGLLWLFIPLKDWPTSVLGYQSLGIAGTPLYPAAKDASRLRYLLTSLGLVGVFLLMQYLFLMPRGSWRIGVQAQGRPMVLSAIGAGFAAVLISVGLLATLLEIPDWWTSLSLSVVWGGIILLWAAWALAFALYWRGMDHQTAIARAMRFLVAGSVLEMLVAAPVHALVHDRDECYCARGSYTGLVLGGTAIIWLFGPGVYLLWLREKQRRTPLIGR